ncbi:MAG: SDR family oxidoreductase [Nanoarchaeota archaeon]|nr:SDR family oxidoreductase [Nanoarchaeota archaeon]
MILKDKKILITGASSGIGAEIARKCAEEGAQLGIHFFENIRGAQELADALSKVTSVKIYQQDFSDEDGKLVSKFVKDFGRIDILVNNAGMIDGKAFEEMTVEDYNTMFYVNSRAPFMLAQQAFKHMKEQGGGKIINISSFAVKYGMGRNRSIHYAASKATLETLTVALARLGAKHNILVNAIRPGVIMTKLQKGREDLDQVLQRIPLNRAGTPADVANTVIHLASDKGGFITGEIITIAGGE